LSTGAAGRGARVQVGRGKVGADSLGEKEGGGERMEQSGKRKLIVQTLPENWREQRASTAKRWGTGRREKVLFLRHKKK